MEVVSLQSLQEQGVPMTFSATIHAPQNGAQRIEHTPVLWKGEITQGQCDPTQPEYYAQAAAQQLA